jgi:putative chitinase
MLPLTTLRLLKVMPQAEPRIAEFIGPLNQALARWDITTDARIAPFLAQAAHESLELTRLEENLSYSAERLCQVWPRRFPTLGDALRYDRKPEKIANRVYGDRLGNGNEASGDGWLYRGRGIFQLTGRSNYRDASLAVAGDADTLLVNPDLVARPEYACATAGWFWATTGCNELADAGDFIAVTRRINGGTLGLTERVALWHRAIQALM